MISRRKLVISAASFFSGGRFLRGMQQAPTTFQGGVKVVNVFATVRDKTGKIVKDLNREDFAIEEDGRPQTVKYFAREANLPLTLGLLLDTSGSMRHLLNMERAASKEFVDQVLREDKDQAFLIHFDREVELLQDLTKSHSKLKSALDHVEAQAPPQLQRRDDPSSTGGGGRGGGGTALYDSILLGSTELMKKEQGRKAFILISDGVDNGSKVSLTEATESAQRADTLVYSIYMVDVEQRNPGFSGPGMGGGRRGGMGGGGRGRMPQQQHADGKKILERISKETGGAMFQATKKLPLDKVYGQIEEELRSQYNLGYTSDKAEGGEYRKIHLTTKKGLIVQARDGYYARSN